MKFHARIWDAVGLGLCLISAGCGGDDEKNAKKTPGGVKYFDQTEGIGDPAKAGDTVELHSTGTLREGGSKFDSSLDPNRRPYVFQLGRGQVIRGWEEGLLGMKKGGKRKLIIPSALGYGKQGHGVLIPPDADLVFEIEMLSVTTPPPRVLKLEKDDIKVGSGDEIKNGSEVEVFYTGRLKSNGRQFDSNVGGKVFSVTVGQGMVIQGWDQGLLGMREGGHRKLSIPASLGYGQTGSGDAIPPDADLEFDIELVRIK